MGTRAVHPHSRLNTWTVAPWFGLAALIALWPRRARRTGDTRVPMPPAAFEAWEPGHGRSAVKPAQIPPRGWRDVLWRTWTETGKDRLQVVAAGVTFYVLLALFPAMGAFVALYGIFADVSTIQKHLNELSLLLPPGAVDLIGSEMLRLAITHHASLSTAFLISLLLSFWSANAGMKALFDGLNIAYDEAEKRNFFARTLITYGFTIGAVVFMVVVSGVMVGAPVALAWIGLSVSDLWWLPVLWLLLFALTVMVFSVVYRYGPSREHARWRWVTWGGVAAAVGWIVGSAGFSAYVSNFAHYDKTYGSLGAFVGFMVWVWFLIFVVLIGAELNSEVERQTAVDTTTGRPLPMGSRGAVVADTIGPAATGRNKRKVRRRPQYLWAHIRGSLRSDDSRPPP